MIRINLISGPRNISTALMYSFAQRIDTTVLDEPYYAFYLNTSGADHPGKEEVLKSQSLKEEDVSKMIFGTWETDVLFIKNMAHHLEIMDPSFLEKVKNIFLIRNPRQIIASYAQVIHTPIMRDLGIEYQHILFNKLKAEGQQPIVIDSGLILENPESVLRQVCELVGIPFSTNMLHWKPGAKSYDGVWANHWYANVHRSSGFEKQPTSNRPLPDHLIELNDKAQNYYGELLPFSLHA